MIKKSISTVVTAAAIAFAATFSLGAAAAEDEKLIVVIFPHAESPFIQNLAKVVELEAEKLGWRSVLRTSTESSDIEEFNRLVQDAPAAGADAMVIQSMEIATVAQSAKRAMEQGVPVIHVNLDLPSPEDGAFLTVMGVAQRAGMEGVGRALGERVNGQAKIVYLAGTSGYHSGERGEGCVAGVKATNPGAVFLGEAPTRWTRESAFDTMMDLIQRFPDLNVVGSASDEIALGGVEALKRTGMLAGVVVGGFDANPNALAAIRAGELTSTVSIGTFEMGIESVKLIKQALEGGETDIEPFMLLPPRIVTPDNIDEFLQAYVDYGIGLE